MFHKALLLLLPTVAYAQISIRGTAIAQITNKSDAVPIYSLNIYYVGLDKEVISDTERRTWKIIEPRLKEMIQVCPWTPEKGYEFAFPDDVLVRNPTPWGNLWADLDKTGNTKEVHRILLPKRDFLKYGYNKPFLDVFPSRIIPGTSEVYILQIDKVYNDKNYTIAYDLNKFKRTVEETLTTTWSMDGELTVSKDINYEFLLKEWDLPDFSYTGSWGKNERISRTATIEYDSVAPMNLEPGEMAVVALMANKHTINIKIQFEASLTGDVLINYANRFEGHHFWFGPVNILLHLCRMRKSFNSNVTIQIVSYADAHIIVTKDFVTPWTPPVHNEPISKYIKFSLEEDQV